MNLSALYNALVAFCTQANGFTPVSGDVSGSIDMFLDALNAIVGGLPQPTNGSSWGNVLFPGMDALNDYITLTQFWSQSQATWGALLAAGQFSYIQAPTPSNYSNATPGPTPVTNVPTVLPTPVVASVTVTPINTIPQSVAVQTANGSATTGNTTNTTAASVSSNMGPISVPTAVSTVSPAVPQMPNTAYGNPVNTTNTTMTSTNGTTAPSETCFNPISQWLSIDTCLGPMGLIEWCAAAVLLLMMLGGGDTRSHRG